MFTDTLASISFKISSYSINHIFLVLSVAVLTASFCYWKKSNNDNTRNIKGAKFPLPSNGPSFNDFFPMGMKTENQISLIEKYGSIFTIPSPLPGVIPNQVVINEIKLVKELCRSHSNKCNFTTRSDVFATATQYVVGRGVTGLKGDEWSWRKRAMIREFHKNKLLNDERGLLEIIMEEGRALCNELDKACDQNEKDHNKRFICADYLTTKVAVGVVLFFLFGRRLEFDTDLMRIAAKDMIDSLFYCLTTPGYHALKYIPFTRSNEVDRKLRNAQCVIDSVVETELKILIEEIEGKRLVHSDRKPGSVMENLIRNESKFKDSGISSMLAEARVFVQAGFETTAHSLAFAMGMLAERPDIANELAQEGMIIFGRKDMDNSNDDNTSYYDIEKMKLALEGRTPKVNQFFHEALRLYPLAPALGGECTNSIDITTQDGIKHTLPKGTAVLFLNMALQRMQLKRKENSSSATSTENDIRLDLWDDTKHSKSEQPFLHTFQNGPHSLPR